MGISKFMIVLIIITTIFLFIDKEQKEYKSNNIEKPTVSFYDSTMYEISQENVHQIIKSKQANIFKEKEELNDATIVLRSDKNKYSTNIISSKYMRKQKDEIFLKNSVNLLVSNGINIKTEELHYDLNSKIAQNDVSFSITREKDTFNGKNIFFNTVTEHIKSEKTQFRMKVETNE